MFFAFYPLRPFVMEYFYQHVTNGLFSGFIGATLAQLLIRSYNRSTMPPRSLLTIVVALIIVLALANAAALYWHLYYHFWWLDVVMHLMGGFWIALAGLTFYYFFPSTFERDRSTLFVTTFAFALTLSLGIFWEVFEFSVDRMTLAFTYHDVTDTLGDLMNDTIGATVATLVFLRWGYHKRNVRRSAE